MNYKVNNFRPNQKVWIHDELTGNIMTGTISDKYCNKRYKFDRKPVHLRTEIPIVWDAGTCGSVHFTNLKSIIR